MLGSTTAPNKSLNKILWQAQPFEISDVRLLEGPFYHAQELDRAYLRSLDPERLLHNFRMNAGLPSTATPLGGWEAPDCELRGHFVGHYLTACAYLIAATYDDILRTNARYLVQELAKCQAESGYLSAFPESFIERVEAQERVWAPWYTLHKLYAGLLDMATLCHDAEALEMVSRMGDWVKSRMDRLSEEQMQRMLANEHGGMNEKLANLYAATGNPDYLDLAQRFNHQAVLEPLSRREDPLTGLHANTQIPKAIGAARQYDLTGNETYRTMAEFFWEVVTQERSYVIGGNSDGERFSPKEHLSQYLSPDSTETCNTYNMLKLTRQLFCWTPQATYADYYERALYNHILASQNPETGMMCYYVPLRAGSHKTFNGHDDSFWCCTGTGIENHTRYTEAIYFHSPETEHSLPRLYVNLFIPSELHWKAQGVTLRQKTNFPEEEFTRFTLTCEQPTLFELAIRHPAWADSGYSVSINGNKIDASEADRYAVISREWRTGDTVEVVLPMRLRTEGFRDNPQRRAFLYGPIVLCATVADRTNPPAIVATVTTNEEILLHIQPVATEPLTFHGSAQIFRSAGEPAGTAVTLTPFYRMYASNYSVYFDLFDREQWQQQETAYREAQERWRDIESRTVDLVYPNQDQSERDHNLQGTITYGGDFGTRSYRDARDNGFFSYDLKVLPDAEQELLCAYWGSDFGRTFTLLVDGAELATQELTSQHPDRFFDVVYPLPPDWTAGKERITLRFQAPQKGMAGGVFGCRILRKEASL